jgi:hypothetical protein
MRRTLTTAVGFVLASVAMANAAKILKERPTRRLPSSRTAAVSGRWQLSQRSDQRNYWRQKSEVSNFYSTAGGGALNQVHSTMTASGKAARVDQPSRPSLTGTQWSEHADRR